MRIILTTCAAAHAERLVETLLGERLIGCANCLPGVRARYWWDGEICREEETLVMMETTAAAVEAAVTRLRALHAYDVAKILVLEPESCAADYRVWLDENVRPG